MSEKWFFLLQQDEIDRFRYSFDGTIPFGQHFAPTSVRLLPDFDPNLVRIRQNFSLNLARLWSYLSPTTAKH